MKVFEIVDQITDSQVNDLYKMYQSEWWTKGRKLTDIQKMLRHSDIITAFCHSENKKLVAFACILTDFVFKALIFDVIVDPSYRGKGMGRTLMDTIINHPSLKSVRHLELYCLPEMVPFYREWGFTEELGEIRFMRRSNEQ